MSFEDFSQLIDLLKCLMLVNFWFNCAIYAILVFIIIYIRWNIVNHPNIIKIIDNFINIWIKNILIILNGWPIGCHICQVDIRQIPKIYCQANTCKTIIIYNTADLIFPFTQHFLEIIQCLNQIIHMKIKFIIFLFLYSNIRKCIFITFWFSRVKK